jgi:Fe-Mn family superoxide dismutase
MAWNQYMTLLMEKLNYFTAGTSPLACPSHKILTHIAQKGTDHESKDLLPVILSTARDPDKARVFNYASAAHNNHWFFRRLTPNPQPMPDTLKSALEESFSSIDTLKREFAVTAEAMFGPGFVWLVKLNPKDVPGQANPFRLVTTYLAGSPYAGAHWRRQGVDRNTVSGDLARAGPLAGPPGGKETPGWGQRVDEDVRHAAPGGINVQPLLCLNTWEHVWLMDYGMGAGGVGGKANFVENWWNVIDWEGVAADANIMRRVYKT